jgi:NAD+ synthase
MNLDKQISSWLSFYLFENKLDTFVIGISGGIDSAVTSILCAQTGHKVIVVLMPILQNPDETNRGINHCNWLKKKYEKIDIVKIDLTDSFNALINIIPKRFHTKLSLANTRARLRMTPLYARESLV